MRLISVPERGKAPADHDMAESFNDTPISMEYCQGMSVQIHWDGTSPVGVFKLQASNNAFTDNVNNNVNPDAYWVDITDASVTVGADTGTHMWNISEIFYSAIRVVYTADGGTPGTGTANIWYVGKEFT